MIFPNPPLIGFIESVPLPCLVAGNAEPRAGRPEQPRGFPVKRLPRWGCEVAIVAITITGKLHDLHGKKTWFPVKIFPAKAVRWLVDTPFTNKAWGSHISKNWFKKRVDIHELWVGHLALCRAVLQIPDRVTDPPDGIPHMDGTSRITLLIFYF